ncbi:MAG: uroporphyrinogen decarboxylase [Oscillospiraceae bacterium]|nr:uroporphyrinogen decarboxylase [Oscillospiraceae bacterium]
MMTQRERFLALLHNEPVDGFVNQYGAMGFLFGSPLSAIDAHPKGQRTVSKWGITYDWPEHEPGAIPMSEGDMALIKDIEDWREYVKAPDLSTKDSDWDDLRSAMKKIDTKEKFLVDFMAPGTFEYTHSMMSFEDSLCNLLVYPDEMHELIDFLTDWRCAYLEEFLKHIPETEVLFAHDDWGSKNSTFMAPETFHEFYTPAYKKFYGLAKDHGLIVIHHSDSYCATLLDDMFEMGIDCWEGVLPSNGIHDLQKKLNDENREFILWGGLDSGVFDRDDSTEEEIRKHVADTIAEYHAGGHWIPSINDGLPLIIHQGNYDIITDEINKQEKLYFK